MKQFLFTVITVLGFSFLCRSQETFWTMTPDVIRAHQINWAYENWEFYDEDGEPREDIDLVIFHFDENGRKKYVIERTLDMVETRDSIIFFYDDDGREILRRKHIEIDPENKISDPSEYSWKDTIEEWKTVYENRRILKISPQLDTFVTQTTRSGRVLTEYNGYTFNRYYYNGRGRLKMKKEIKSAKVWGKNGGFQPMDTLVTRYNKDGNPISTTGNTMSIDYEYENGLLISKVKTSREYDETRVVKSEYNYDDKGQLIQEKVWINGRPYDWRKLEYDENGFLIKETSFDEKSGLIDLVIEYRYY